MEAEARANDLANCDSMISILPPWEEVGVRAGDRGSHGGNPFVKRRCRGKTNPTLFVSRVCNSHSGGIHKIKKAGGVRRGARGHGKLEGGRCSRRGKGRGRGRWG